MTTHANLVPVQVPTAGVPGLLPKECLDVPAIFSNSSQLTMNALYARVTFGEMTGEPGVVRYHTAISMATSDLKFLAETILSTVQKAQELASSQPQATK